MKFLLAALAALPAVWAGTDSQLSWMNTNGNNLNTQIPVSQDDIANESFWQKQAASHGGRHLCIVRASKTGGDDGATIVDVFTKECAEHSLVVFPDPVYSIQTAMTTEGMKDVYIAQFGRFLWSTDIQYWLGASMPVGWQNQSTAWYFGGEDIVWDGYGQGTLDGNGQVWYDYNENRSNLAHRPININYRYFTNSVVRNMRFVQSQMWTMVLCYGQNVLFDNIYVNNTSTSQWGTVNTDGIDTIWSDNITLRGWSVTNGDDSVALKDNSTNIYLEDSVFYNGQGIAIGSIGQFKGNFSYIENFFARNITGYNTNYAAYVKTWPGIQDGYPPNGGGGGLGFAKNIVIQDVTLHGSRSDPIYMEQCENYEGHELQSCNTSLFKLEDVLWKNIVGTTVSTNNYAGTFLCSGAAGGCSNITVEGFDVTVEGTDQVASIWHCENVNGEVGFNCTAGSSRP